MASASLEGPRSPAPANTEMTMIPCRHTLALVFTLAFAALLHPAEALAESEPARQSRDDAWWTGPMLANGAETLPQGHYLIEPYVYDVIAPRTDGFGSRAYVLYGLADRWTVGFIPIIGYNRVSGGPNSSGVKMGDLTVQAQYRLRRFEEGSWLPTMSLLLQESLPTARYDRLGELSADGMGSGAYGTTLSLNSQSYFWLANGRILRARLDLSAAWSRRADIDGVSVYGTGPNFHGKASPGSSFSVDGAVEYSVTRNWVMALDLIYSHYRDTTVSGYDLLGVDIPVPVRRKTGSSNAYGFAPAIEYNWSPNIGILFGTRVILGGHGTTTTVTPAIALNYVH
jgi:hypothetical protein